MAATYDWSEYVTTKQQQQQEEISENIERPQRRSSLLDAGIDFIMGTDSTIGTNRTGTTMYGGSIVRGLENDNDDVHHPHNGGGGGGGGGGTNHPKYDESDSYFTDDDEYGVAGDRNHTNEMVGVVNVVSASGGGSNVGARRGYSTTNGRRSTSSSNNSNCVSVLKRIRWRRVCCACSVLVGFILLIVAMVTAVTNKAQIDTVNTLLDETTIDAAVVEAAGMTATDEETQEDGSSVEDMSITTTEFEEQEFTTLEVQDKSTTNELNPSKLYTNDMVDHIENLASSISSDRAFLTGTAPHKAMEWFLTSDENAQFMLDQKLLDMDTSDVTATAKLYQRYVVVTILFGLLGENDSNNIHNFIDASIFVCQWNGVTCNDEGYVTHLSLDGQNFKGSLVEEIGYLPQLIWLDVSENHLKGTLPSTMDQLTKLEHLYIEENDGGITLGTDNSNPAVCTLRDNYKLIHFEMDCPTNEDEVEAGDSNTLENKCICCTKCYDPNASSYSSAVNYITSFFTNTESDETPSSTNVDELLRQTIESLYYNDGSSSTSDVDSSYQQHDVSILHQDSNNSPQHEAYMWLMYEDTYFETSIKSTILTDELRMSIVERYVLALLYFQMLSNEEDSVNWIYDGSSVETCKWEHVECHSSSGGRITHLNLGGKQLSSTLTYEIMYLNKLQHLDLANNHITGKLPVDAISKLSQLELLYLQENELDQDALTSPSSASGICSLRYQNLKHFVVDCNVDCTCCTSCGKQ